ncbi:carbohydrate-binding protein, partial [Sphaerimonospora thailandensis]|uniref:carbohydrate-binding protein n=1 Tax=Sphaerimonospora thailandensis TaxID=795644 RepID=UPI00194FCCA1
AEGSNPGGGKPASPTCDGSTVAGVGIRKAGQIFMGGLNLKTTPWTHAKARAATVRVAAMSYARSCVELRAVKAAWSAINVPAAAGEPVCEWTEGVRYVAGDLVRYLGHVYRCRQDHPALRGWEPPAVPALWELQS